MMIARAVPFLLLALAPGAAAGNYLQLPGIKGSSTDKAHAGWIPVESFSWMASHTGGAASGATRSGERTQGPREIKLVIRLDQSATALAQAATKGTPFPTATLDAAGVHYFFKNVMIKGVQTQGGTGASGIQMEELTLAFASYTIQYPPKTEPKPVRAAPMPVAPAVIHPAPPPPPAGR